MKSALREFDPNNDFTKQINFLENDRIPNYLSNSDIFVFASSCENMPNTLIEGMASCLPIVCSNRGPMPEILKDGGIYFNPEKPRQIASAIKFIIKNPIVSKKLSEKAFKYSNKFSWKKCGEETWKFICHIYKIEKLK